MALDPQPSFTWSVTGGGSVNSSGLFTAGATPGGPFDMTAIAGDVVGTAKVTVTLTPPPPLLIIDSPLENETLLSGNVIVKYRVSGNYAGSGVNHVHFQLDGNPEVLDLDFDGTYTFAVVPNGSHQLKGYLAANDHSQIGEMIGPVNFQVNSITNQAPLVDAGQNQSITLPAQANLHGNVVDDGLPNPPGKFTVQWLKVSGPGTVTFDDVSTLNARVAFSAPGTYVLRLTAHDGQFVGSDDVTVSVTSNSAQSGVTGRRQLVVRKGQTAELPECADDLEVRDRRGNLVIDLDQQNTWDGKLPNGSDAAAGTYIATCDDSDGHKLQFKLGRVK
jgi:hypothetical protein